MPESDHLFVYGTLRAEVKHPMHGVLAAHTRPLGPAWFEGLLYDVGDYPAAIPSKSQGERVVGEVYAIIRSEPLLEALDRYEGCTEIITPATLYRREIHPFQLPDGRVIPAWMYLYHQATDGLRKVVGGDYVADKETGRC